MNENKFWNCDDGTPACHMDQFCRGRIGEKGSCGDEFYLTGTKIKYADE